MSRALKVLVATGVLVAAVVGIVLAAGGSAETSTAGARTASAPAGTAAAAAAATEPTCFGAAARDTQNPCSNPTPTVFPTVEKIDADFVGGSPCNPVPGNPAPICAFGVSKKQAKRHFALMGDSHALHWRRALDVVALGEQWRGYSITTAACPFTVAVNRLPLALRPLCQTWFKSARMWFKDHPEVSVLFVSQFAPLAIEPPKGRTIGAVKVDSFRRTWTALPKTVKHIITIRDNPLTTQATFDCVQKAIADAAPDPGQACTEGREYAVPWDTAVSAATSLHSTRYQSVDLTEFFCDAKKCYPVIGGARVYRDPFGHLTTAYARTLGPFLQRDVRALMKSW